jgi:hypothetical protein
MTDNLIDRPLREILVVANGDPEKAIALLREQIRPGERSGGMSEAEFKRRIIDRIWDLCDGH